LTFSDIIGVGAGSFGQRTATGHPAREWTSSYGLSFNYNWDVYKDRYLHLYREARDYLEGAETPSLQGQLPANAGALLQYYSRGVHWQDIRSYSRKVDDRPKSVSFTVSQEWVPAVYSPDRVIPPVKDRAGKIIIPGRTIPGVLIRPGYSKPIPRTIATLIIDDRVGSTSGQYQYRTITATTNLIITNRLIYPYWLSRSIQFGGVSYYPTPKTEQIWCQTELGPGALDGPYGHDGKPLNSKIGVAASDLDPQTVERRWWTRPTGVPARFIKNDPGGGFILFSPIGERVENTPGIFKRGNAAARNLVINCIDQKPRYLADATNQPCIVKEPSHPLFGRKLPGTHELCKAFVPGNYWKDLSQSKEMLCTLVTRSAIGFDVDPKYLVGDPRTSQAARLFLPASDNRTLAHCSDPISAANNPFRSKSPNAIDYPLTRAFWACEGDNPQRGNRTWHPDPNYDFLTCGYTFVCQVPGGDPTPIITDVNSNTETRGTSQVLASGAQTKVTWLKPSGVGVYDSRGRLLETIRPDESKAWQTWSVLGNSQPWYPNSSPNDQSQPVFGNNNPNTTPGSNNSVLNSGVNGWSSADLYLRGYKGTNIADSTTRMGDLLVRTGDLIPFAVYTEYNATIPKETVVLGNRVTMNMPVTCNMPPAYLYYISGRATG
jgi:hypothetical protein